MSQPKEVFVLPGLRSPFAKIDRELSRVGALELSVPVVQQTVAGARGPGADRAGEVDLVVWGSVIPVLSVSNWGREVWLDAGLDPHVPALTMVEQCATSLAAATHAAAQVRTGHAELALCGGVESMSNTQVGLSRGLSRALRRAGTAKGPAAALRHLRALRPRDIRVSVPAVEERTTGKSMGQHCEEMAKEWGVPRAEQDEVAAASHAGAARAAAEGFFRSLLVTPGTFALDADSIPRPDTTPEALAALRPAFDRVRGTLTAGNSSPLTDGAACCWVAGAAGAARLPAALPRARLLDWEQAAIDPRRDGLLMAPALAIPRLLARHDLGYADIGLWEIHEAFAAQLVCTLRALESEEWLRERAGTDRDFGAFPRDRINPNGGSVALGHPFAATGARILSQAVAELAGRPAGTRAVVSICAAGGLGLVALLEAV
ncbi:MAG: acetyl-CoA C-acyltransferase [Gemmatimonadota bacterium]|nr:acetyl-CoA C-acyltransferase [Gemmatimonadota bacterium]